MRSGSHQRKMVALASISTQSANQPGIGPFDLRAIPASRTYSPLHRSGNISAIRPAMSSDGGRAPVSALTITVRSKPSSRAS
jgi:hypothetical protein